MAGVICQALLAGSVAKYIIDNSKINVMVLH